MLMQVQDATERTHARIKPVHAVENRIHHFYVDIRERVRTYGYACMDASDPDGGTTADPAGRCFFTLGMTESDLPELIVTGNLTRRSALELIDRVARELRRTRGSMPLGIRDDLAPVRIELRPIATPAHAPADGHAGMMEMLYDLYPERACVVQIIWADSENRLPGDARWAGTVCRQVVYPQLPFVTGTVTESLAGTVTETLAALSEGGNH